MGQSMCTLRPCCGCCIRSSNTKEVNPYHSGTRGHVDISSLRNDPNGPARVFISGIDNADVQPSSLSDKKHQSHHNYEWRESNITYGRHDPSNQNYANPYFTTHSPSSAATAAAANLSPTTSKQRSRTSSSPRHYSTSPTSSLLGSSSSAINGSTNEDDFSEDEGPSASNLSEAEIQRLIQQQVARLNARLSELDDELERQEEECLQAGEKEERKIHHKQAEFQQANQPQQQTQQSILNLPPELQQEVRGPSFSDSSTFSPSKQALIQNSQLKSSSSPRLASHSQEFSTKSGVDDDEGLDVDDIDLASAVAVAVGVSPKHIRQRQTDTQHETRQEENDNDSDVDFDQIEGELEAALHEDAAIDLDDDENDTNDNSLENELANIPDEEARLKLK